MASVRPNVNGYLADIDRIVIVKRRLLASDDFSAQNKRECIAACDKIVAILTKRSVELGVTADVVSARLPRRKGGKNGNGHTAKSA